MAEEGREAAKRRNQLAAIHVAKRELRLTEDDYRALLRGLAAVESAADLDWAGRQRVLDAMRKLGWRSGRVRSRPAASKQSTKIKALWLELARLGAVRDASEGALSKFCFRMVRIHRAEWMTAKQANVVIESLKQWLRRVKQDEPVS